MTAIVVRRKLARTEETRTEIAATRRRRRRARRTVATATAIVIATAVSTAAATTTVTVIATATPPTSVIAVAMTVVAATDATATELEYAKLLKEQEVVALDWRVFSRKSVDQQMNPIITLRKLEIVTISLIEAASTMIAH